MHSLRTCLDVIKSKGVTDIFERIIKPGQRGHFFKNFYGIASFLKHANQDPNALLELSPNLPKGNEALIVIATTCFCDAFGEKIGNLILHAAMFYYIKLNPNIYQLENEYVETLNGLDTNQLEDEIRRLVKEGPSILGLKPGTDLGNFQEWWRPMQN